MLDDRGFDPLFLDRIDEGFAANEFADDAEDFTLIERCTVCGADELVRETDGQLVDLNGELHVCPEAA